MRKLVVICSWALLLGGCKSECGSPEPDGSQPAPPPSAELLQKIGDLNEGLVVLKTLAGAVAQSEVRSVAETEAGVGLMFRDGTEVVLACNAAAETPLVGIAADGDVWYWTLASEKDKPWLKDASGGKMPVSGPVPVMGRDNEGFWTVTTDAAVTPWRIGDASGNPVKAVGNEHVALFRSVKAENGRVEIALADGGSLSAAQVNDLSAAGTANCYVVSAPGTYVFNARVRGNGAGEGVGFEPAIELADNMTADWLWTDSEGLVSEIGLDKKSGDMVLKVGEGRGNTLVALMQEGRIVWSWHIWVTDAPQTMAYENGVVFMDRNLGAVGTTVGGTDAYGMYYQWGRKDPFYWGTKTETSANAFLEAKNGTVVNPAYPELTWNITKTAVMPEVAAANPMTFYNNKVGNDYNWLAKPNARLWGEAKTLNDPCPPGYKVPDIDAWENLSSGRNYIEGVSAWDVENYGVTYTHNGQTAWYPGQGYRTYSSGAIVGQRASSGGSGGYWSSKATAAKAYYLYVKKQGSTSGSINPELDVNRSYGYTVRCCKE
ncbi:PL29 family lyase N-terminal domain-containing protein [Alistipes sp.]|uniref:PL29 family lyase N-terminal domain-containing protein n=1 Tax=Alistipes sp. TaxID=1872444 RepID=UPI0025B9166E|nr:PL29 family lyase N-terminal domain-containing protein [Alistipes sp.]